MGDFSATVDNHDYVKIMNMLSNLSHLEREAVIAKGIQEGLKVVVEQGKSNLMSSGIHLNNMYTGKRAGKTTHLIKSFKIVTKKRDLRGYGGFKRPDGCAAHIIDRGTKIRSTKKGANRGMVNGNYFWTNAVKDKSGKAQQELMDSVIKSVENIMKRNQ